LEASVAKILQTPVQAADNHCVVHLNGFWLLTSINYNQPEIHSSMSEEVGISSCVWGGIELECNQLHEWI